MEDAFLDMLESEAALTALVGAGDDARIYPVILPQDAQRPAITYQVISDPRTYNQDGEDGLHKARVQLDLYGSSYSQCQQLRNVIVDNFSGAIGERFGSPEIKISACFIEDAGRDLYESALDADGPKLFRKSLDIIVAFRNL